MPIAIWLFTELVFLLKMFAIFSWRNLESWSLLKLQWLVTSTWWNLSQRLNHTSKRLQLDRLCSRMVQSADSIPPILLCSTTEKLLIISITFFTPLVTSTLTPSLKKTHTLTISLSFTMRERVLSVLSIRECFQWENPTFCFWAQYKLHSNYRVVLRDRLSLHRDILNRWLLCLIKKKCLDPLMKTTKRQHKVHLMADITWEWLLMKQDSMISSILLSSKNLLNSPSMKSLKRCTKKLSILFIIKLPWMEIIPFWNNLITEV